MSSTSFITLSLLIKAWILGILFYLIRTTSSEFDIMPHLEITFHIAAGLAVLGSESIFGISLGGGKAMEMSRQESDLVKDYLKNRMKNETLGDYLMRVEAEEERQTARSLSAPRKRSKKSTLRS